MENGNNAKRQEELQQTTDNHLRKRTINRGPLHNEQGEAQGESPKSQRYAYTPILDADVYASNTQMNTNSTNNQDRQPGKIDNTNGEARLRK